MKAVAGDSILLPCYGPGMNAPPIPEEVVVVGVTERMAKNSRYVGAMLYLEDYGSLAVFEDKSTGVCFAQCVST